MDPTRFINIAVMALEETPPPEDARQWHPELGYATVLVMRVAMLELWLAHAPYMTLPEHKIEDFQEVCVTSRVILSTLQREMEKAKEVALARIEVLKAEEEAETATRQ